MERSTRWPLVVIAICVLLVFGRLFTAQFTRFDDRGTIVDNPHLGHSVDWDYFWAHPVADIYAPLTYTAWGLLTKATWVATPDETGSHVDAHFFHGASVILHLVAAMLVYALLLRMVHRPWAAMIGALLFALHPLQVEAVAWASGMKDVLAGMLSILALLLYVRYAQGGGRSVFAVATAIFAAALLAKPSVVTTPLLAAIIDRWLIGRPWRRIVGPIVIWLAMCIPIVIVNRAAQVSSHAAAVPAWFRPLIAGDALTFYLCKLVAPVGLAIQYPLRPHEMLQMSWAFAGWVMPIGLAILILLARKRWIAVGALVFAAAPLTVLGFLAFDWQWYSAVADHYLYVAMLGPAIVVAGILTQARTVAIVCCSIVLIALGVLSARQAGFWKDNTALARHTLAVNPRSFVAYTIFGAERIETEPQAAISAFKSALAIEPTYTKVLGAAKAMLEARGRTAEVVELVKRYVDAEEALPPAARDDLRAAKEFLAGEGRK